MYNDVVFSRVHFKNVVVVDDSQFVVKQLSQILMSDGYTILATAYNGLDAVKVYKDYFPRINFITLDITMPIMDGITALEEILSFDKSAKVVMISALGTEKMVKKALLLGALGYILKPLNREKVLRRIDRFMWGG